MPKREPAPVRESYAMPMKLHVANLSHQVDEAELARLFADYGVRSTKVFDRLATSERTATGLVEIDTEEHGASAIAALNGAPYRGSALVVSRAKPGQDKGINLSRMFEPVKVPEGRNGRPRHATRGPRPGGFGDRGGSGGGRQ